MRNSSRSPKKHSGRDSLKRILIGLLATGCLACSTSQRVTTSWQGDVSPVKRAIDGLLADSKDVSIAIISSAETTASRQSFLDLGVDMESWRATVAAEISGIVEREYLARYSNYPRFRLVDRAHTEQILKELTMSAYGFISNQQRLQFGNLTGATYLVHVDLGRIQNEASSIDNLKVKLIEVATGNVLASQQTTVQK